MNRQPMSLLARAACPALAALVATAGAAGAEAAAVETTEVVEVVREPRAIDLALCLDTSGSMNGLIDAARQKLWAIVNDLAVAEPTPRLRVALLTFGNDGHNAEDGWVAVQTPFTDDLDLVSERLFALTTNGGTEYVGRVLRYAGQLGWHPSDDALKLVVVAGNESADQDQEVPFRAVCRELIAGGVMVNSIYCGPATDTIAPAWKEVALLADGQFASIDQDHGTVVVETPFDDQLAELSAAVNATYIPFGAVGAAGADNQRAQDDNAARLNPAASASRAQTKASRLYHCSWDLVDACGAGQVKVEELAADELPEAMQAMTVEQRVTYVEEMRSRRADVQTRITDLSRQRDRHIAEEMKRQALDGSSAFDSAVRQAIREQAATKGFRFAEEPAEPAAPEASEETG